MADVDIRVLGIKQAVENLRLMSFALAQRVTRKAVRGGTRVIAKQIKATVYSGDRHKQTGLLQRSMSMTVSSKKSGQITGKIIAAPVNVTGKSKVAQHVRRARKAKLGNATEMPAFYWRFLEKGTQRRATSGGANRGRVSARPWVVPAFDAKSGEALDVFGTIFNRETEDEARKLNTGVPTS